MARQHGLQQAGKAFHDGPMLRAGVVSIKGPGVGTAGSGGSSAFDSIAQRLAISIPISVLFGIIIYLCSRKKKGSEVTEVQPEPEPQTETQQTQAQPQTQATQAQAKAMEPTGYYRRSDFRRSSTAQAPPPADGGGGGDAGSVLPQCLALTSEIIAAAGRVVANHARCHLLAERIQVGSWGACMVAAGGRASDLPREPVLWCCGQSWSAARWTLCSSVIVLEVRACLPDGQSLTRWL
jgi:hypothetical protein